MPHHPRRHRFTPEPPFIPGYGTPHPLGPYAPPPPHSFDHETSSVIPSDVDTESTLFPGPHTHFERKHSQGNPHHPAFPLHPPHHAPPPFLRLPLFIPTPSTPLSPQQNDILLHPPLLARLKATIRGPPSTPFSPPITQHISLTYDLRIREITKRLTSSMPANFDTTTWIKVRGEWWDVEVGSKVCVSDILRLERLGLSEKGEMEVWIEVCERARRERVKFEKETRKETKKVEKVRVYE